MHLIYSLIFKHMKFSLIYSLIFKHMKAVIYSLIFKHIKFGFISRFLKIETKINSIIQIAYKKRSLTNDNELNDIQFIIVI
jgi:hypothetical protein